MILVHGITGDPDVFDPFLALYGPGRHVLKEFYAAEADALKPGDLPVSCVVNAGYYKDSMTGVRYDLVNGVGTSSIGGAPVPRSDGNGSRYPVSYTKRLQRIVEGVRRATGSDRVDLVCHSMGNLIGRAYIRWHSDGAKGGKSKVRRYISLAGPHRGINAAEAYGLGFSRSPLEEFMQMGEIAEMCGEYRIYGGKSFTELLNDDWDGFCKKVDVTYGGSSAIGPHGKQVDPKGLGTTYITIAAVILNLVQGIQNVSTLADLQPFLNVFYPQNLIPEAIEAFGPGDRVVRLAISRLDQAPFLAAQFWSPFEGRHQGAFNFEQSILGTTFTSELARQFLAEGSVPKSANVALCDLKLVDAPGKASWLLLETKATGLSAAQLVEENLDSSGKPTGAATGYGCPIRDGEQRSCFQVPAGGGDRRYRVVLYGPNGIAFSNDLSFTLTDGALDAAPSTVFTTATWTTSPSGTLVSATFASSTQDPSLELTYRLDGGAWTPWATSTTFDTPGLGPGEHRLEARARHADNGARVLAEDPRGAAIGIFVDAAGRVTVRR